MTIPLPLTEALAARDAGHHAEAVRLLRPLAEDNNVEAQVHVADLIICGVHRFANTEEMVPVHGLRATGVQMALSPPSGVYA
jgi:hypothetical protein